MQRSWEEACKYLVSVAKRGGLCVASGLCVANPVHVHAHGMCMCMHSLLWCDTRCVVFFLRSVA